MTSPLVLQPDPTSVIGRRISAWTFDLVLFLALSFGVLMATGGFDWRTTTYPNAGDAEAACAAYEDSTNGRICSVAGAEAVFVDIEGNTNGVWIAYTIGYILLQGLTGGSPGKLLLGLRVVDEHGTRIGIGKSLLRTFLWVADAITCGLPIVGGVAMVSTKGHRRLGDMGAGTYVVARKDVGTPVGLAVMGAGMATSMSQWRGPTGQPVPLVPAADGPIWDEVRDTYIQYDRNAEAWVQWSEAERRWNPIDR